MEKPLKNKSKRRKKNKNNTSIYKTICISDTLSLLETLQVYETSFPQRATAPTLARKNKPHIVTIQEAKKDKKETEEQIQKLEARITRLRQMEEKIKMKMKHNEEKTNKIMINRNTTKHEREIIEKQRQIQSQLIQEKRDKCLKEKEELERNKQLAFKKIQAQKQKDHHELKAKKIYFEKIKKENEAHNIIRVNQLRSQVVGQKNKLSFQRTLDSNSIGLGSVKSKYEEKLQNEKNEIQKNLKIIKELELRENHLIQNLIETEQKEEEKNKFLDEVLYSHSNRFSPVSVSFDLMNGDSENQRHKRNYSCISHTISMKKKRNSSKPIPRQISPRYYPQLVPNQKNGETINMLSKQNPPSKKESNYESKTISKRKRNEKENEEVHPHLGMHNKTFSLPKIEQKKTFHEKLRENANKSTIISSD